MTEEEYQELKGMLDGEECKSAQTVGVPLWLVERIDRTLNPLEES